MKRVKIRQYLSSIACIYTLVTFSMSSHAQSVSIGAGFRDGPLMSMQFREPLNEKVEKQLTLSGIPGIVLWTQLDYKLAGNRASRYWKPGVGILKTFRGRHTRTLIVESHIYYGVEKSFIWPDLFWRLEGGVVLLPAILIKPMINRDESWDMPALPVFSASIRYQF